MAFDTTNLSLYAVVGVISLKSILLGGNQRVDWADCYWGSLFFPLSHAEALCSFTGGLFCHCQYIITPIKVTITQASLLLSGITLPSFSNFFLNFGPHPLTVRDYSWLCRLTWEPHGTPGSLLRTRQRPNHCAISLAPPSFSKGHLRLVAFRAHEDNQTCFAYIKFFNQIYKYFFPNDINRLWILRHGHIVRIIV